MCDTQVGIYLFTNVGDGKNYVGSTEVLANRRHQHVSDLRKGKHKNVHLQRAWDKHGEEAFAPTISALPAPNCWAGMNGWSCRGSSRGALRRR
jgi:hypothetical protein